MSKPVDVLQIDSDFYDQHLREFLPEHIIDIHTHVWLERLKKNTSEDPRLQSWPLKVTKENSIEQLIQTNRLLFPGKRITPMIFSFVGPHDDIDSLNSYVNKCATEFNFPSIIWSSPGWDAQELERQVVQGNFIGIKPYLNQAPSHISPHDITIFDFIPKFQLEVLNQHRWILMLHIPRPTRLGDPLNLEQMFEIEKNYPNIKLIVAHVGRAYCPEHVGKAFELLAETENMLFDFSANTNIKVFEGLIKAVGTKRILYGSDLPITRMRMRRICEKGHYINIVPRGLYGDVSDDKHMREAEGIESKNLTFFIYEQINAFQQASAVCGLTRKDINDIFYNNALRIIAGVQNESEKTSCEPKTTS